MVWLITGGAGYIGSHVAEYLESKKIEFVILDDLSSGQKTRIKQTYKFYKGDICDTAFVDEVFSRESIRGLIHLAAKKDISESYRAPDEYRRVNVEGTKNLLSACRNFNVKNIIFSSTAAVYAPGFSEKHLDEEAEVFPLSPYAQSKYEAETLIRGFDESNSMQFIIFRFFNVTGSSKTNLAETSGQNLWPMLKMAVNTNKVFEVYGHDYPTRDGTCVRDYLHVQDIASAHLKAIDFLEQSNKSELTLNLGTGSGLSVLEVISQMEKSIGRQINYVKAGRRVGDIASVVCNPGLANEILGWKAEFNPFHEFVSDLEVHD
jgi:UDP-glucose 4-epimerase